MKKLFILITLVVSLSSRVEAQQFHVVDTSQVKLDWTFPLPLAPGASFTITCNGILPSNVIIVTGVTNWPVLLNTVITQPGTYTCYVQAVSASGVVGNPSNTVQTTVKQSELILR